MIYEFRTYNVRTGKVPDYHKAFAEKIEGRMKYSRMAGHWYTEVGRLNQMVAIWPYEDLEQRIEIRRLAESAEGGTVWPPQSGQRHRRGEVRDLLSSAVHGADGAGQDRADVRDAHLPLSPGGDPRRPGRFCRCHPRAGEKLSPLAGCWYSDFGGVNNFVSMWAYPSFEERLRIRKEAQDRGIWPPPKAPMPPTTQVTKILWPAAFSPMQ